MNRRLSSSDGTTLLTLARRAITDRLLGDGSLDRAIEDAKLTAPLAAPRAAFVTLKSATASGTETLRGCIGTLDAETPLYRNVILAAPQAAFEDPRFPALEVDELADIRIEISALTTPRPLGDIADLELGRDGVQLNHGERRALFLPQVGAERDWTVEQFLENLASKAGLPDDAWRQSRLSAFQVEAFREPRD